MIGWFAWCNVRPTPPTWGRSPDPTLRRARWAATAPGRLGLRPSCYAMASGPDAPDLTADCDAGLPVGCRAAPTTILMNQTPVAQAAQRSANVRSAQAEYGFELGDSLRTRGKSAVDAKLSFAQSRPRAGCDGGAQQHGESDVGVDELRRWQCVGRKFVSDRRNATGECFDDPTTGTGRADMLADRHEASVTGRGDGIASKRRSTVMP